MNAFDRLLGFLFYLACILLAGAMLIVALQVVYRQLYGGLPWIIEIGEYILLQITFLSAAWVLRQEGHVSIDILSARLRPRVKAILNIITSTIALALCLVLVWYGSTVTLKNFQMGTPFYKEIGLPRAPIMAIIPVGFFLLSVQFARRIYGYTTALRMPGVSEAENQGYDNTL